MSLKELDLLIEHILKEREYVSGSKLPTQKPTEDSPTDFPMTGFGTTKGGAANLKTAIKRLIDYCSGVEESRRATVMKGASTSEKFKRVIGSEFLHKLLNITIPASNALGFNDKQAGFSLEKQFAALLGGEVIPPASKGEIGIPEDVQFVMGGGKWSMKFYKASSIKSYGFGQALSTMENWIKVNKATSKLRYLIFVKLTNEEDTKVGFELFEAEFSYQEIEDIINKHYQKAANSKTVPLEDRFYSIMKASHEFDYVDIKELFKPFGNESEKKQKYNQYRDLFNGFIIVFEDEIAEKEGYDSWTDDREVPFRQFISTSDQYKTEFNKFKTKYVPSIKLYKGSIPSFSTSKGGTAEKSVGSMGDLPKRFDNQKLKPLGRLLMPRDIDKFMETSFTYLEDDINELYTNLDNFRDSLKEYYLDSNKTTRNKTEGKFDSLKTSFDISFSENNELYASTLDENVKKVKK